ncbi:MAG: hypothetical protein JRH20_30740, partial [Deltaproteobacteria bacterium]|nr:hypothetical protein [Deltaproteobacteria bacterium]
FAQAHNIAVDDQGDVYIAGELTGPVDFGAGSMSPTAAADGFVVKYSKSGTLLWFHHITGDKSSIDFIKADYVLMGPESSVVVAGTFTGSITIDGQRFAQQSDTQGIFIYSFEAPN